MHLQYNLQTEKQVSSIYFSFFGDNTHLIQKNDSLIYYYSDFKNFSIKYKPSNNIDIYGKTNGSEGIPVEIMFLRKNESLYFILLVHKNITDKFDTKALSFLINGASIKK
jgi:hypothetical protein